MKYLSEINAFQDWLETHQLPPSAIALWYALMGIANKAFWPDDLAVPISALQTRTGCGRDAVYAARKALKESGRITFAERKGRLSAVYHLIPFVSDNPLEIPTQSAIAKKLVSDNPSEIPTQPPAQNGFASGVVSGKPTENPTIYRQRQDHSQDKEEDNKAFCKKTTRKKKEAKSSDREGTIAYAEYVYLKPAEYAALCEDHGKAGADRMIVILDSYKGSTGKEYRDDYRTIKNWVVNRWRDEQPRRCSQARQMPTATSYQESTDFFTE